MNGILYGIGVGPGDPELMTQKAIRVIGECPVIAVPDSKSGELMALQIAEDYVRGKETMTLPMPMTHDRGILAESRKRAADAICEKLDVGQNVGFLTLGDPTVYSTYAYLHKIITNRGYTAVIIPGVPSFCAAAAALGTPLCEAGEPVHILPATYGNINAALSLDGTKVLMKSGNMLDTVLSSIRERKLLSKTLIAERVGMEGERLIRDIPEQNESGYFSIVIVKGETA